MGDKIRLQQAFYGCDAGGYRVLGITDRRYFPVVEKLCSGIGTPDGISKVSPFLLSLPVQDMLFMACCRLGASDAAGRQTLFFHLFYGPQEECRLSGVNAFTLFRGGLFAELPNDECPPIEIDANGVTSPVTTAPFIWSGNDLAIISESPQNDLLEALLGDQVFTAPWASFAFTPLSNFKIYAISKFVATPVGRECRDPAGKIIVEAPPPPPNPPEIHQDKSSAHEGVYIRRPRRWVAILLVLLAISVAGNIYQWNAAKKTKTNGNVCNNASICGVDAIKENFPKEKIISDSEFEEMKKEINGKKDTLKEMGGYEKFLKNVDNVFFYIEFINNQNQKQGE